MALSTFWQGDYLYVSAGLNGIFVVDVTDPLSPTLVHQHREVGHLVGSFHVIGNLALSSSAGLAQTFLYDMSDPLGFEPIAGGNWLTQSADGGQANYYFANTGGRYALFARKDTGVVQSFTTYPTPNLQLRRVQPSRRRWRLCLSSKRLVVSRRK